MGRREPSDRDDPVKITISEIKRLLSEATCPLCGDTNAYQGLSSFECSTKGCPNFSQKQVSLSDEPTDPLYVWARAQLEKLMDEGRDEDDVRSLWTKLEARLDQDVSDEYVVDLEEIVDDAYMASHAKAEMRIAPHANDDYWEVQFDMNRDMSLDGLKEFWKKYIGK